MDLPKIVRERLEHLRKSPSWLLTKLKGKLVKSRTWDKGKEVKKSAFYDFLGNSSGINSQVLGMILDELGLDVVPKSGEQDERISTLERELAEFKRLYLELLQKEGERKYVEWHGKYAEWEARQRENPSNGEPPPERNPRRLTQWTNEKPPSGECTET